VVIQIAGAAGERVEVQVRQRGGTVRVHVRTADTQLSSVLRSNLGELVQSITDKGLRIQAWTPAETWPLQSPLPGVEAVAAISETAFAGNQAAGHSGDQQASGEQRRAEAHSRNNSDMNDGHRRGRARELWLEEMERGND
jgi:hypothetical protein